MIINNDSIKWFTGIVEDRMDPMKLGRVKVRVFGLHPFQKTQGDVLGISTEDLPWMEVLQPSNSASMSGIGYTPTGPVEGTKVYGHWLDKYNVSGLVIGTIVGINRNKPNKLEGFADPTGQYPRFLGSDTNALNQGGQDGYEYQANVIQDSNADIGINPDDRDFSDIPEDPNPAYTINLMIRRDEGLGLKVYWDVRGYTVGIGHFIGEFARGDMAGANAALSKQIGRTVTGNPGIIYIEEADKLFEQDLAKVQRDIKINAKTGPVYIRMNRSRQMALENMAFQMGIGGLAKFEKMLDAMYIGNWETAYKEAKDSTWANQTPGRAGRVSMIIRVGNMESYGIPVPKKSVGAMAAAATENVDPADPWTPTDSRILFKEPDSSYAGEYPYVHTYESESGHIQEFDDTPGHERYRIMHPTGSYVEVAPSGRRTTKTVSDEYNMVQGNRNEYTAGRKSVNVGGDETYYNMSNVRRQTDGSEDIYIRGNEVKTIDGNGTLIVKGNVKVIIQGTADIRVEQEAMITVEKDTTINCNQDADISVKQKATINAQNMDVNVEESLNFTATDINLSASNTITSDAAVLNTVTGGNVQVG